MLLLRLQSSTFVSHGWWQIPRLTDILLYGFLALVSASAIVTGEHGDDISDSS